MEKNTEAIEYEAPRVADHGDLTELTAAQSAGGYFDANYKVGQPIPPGFKQSGP